MDLLALLAAGDVEGFNTQRTERAKLDFFAADLPGIDLSDIDLSMANLDKSDLTGSNLSGASLYKTSMTGIDGTDLVLTSILGHRLRLKEAWLENADLSDAELSHADFKEAHLVGSKARGAVMKGARLVEVEASGCDWPEVDLVEAQLHKGNFSKANLRGADLSEAVATSVNFSGARLDSVQGTGLKAQGSNFTGASLMGARLLQANLSGADFTGADLSAADLTGANLSGAILTGARLGGAILADAVLEGIDFAGVDLEDVDLSGVDAKGLGLTADQLDALAAHGATFDPDAPLIFKDPAVARHGTTTAVLWLNTEGEVIEGQDPTRTVRFCLISLEGQVIQGVLPVSADQVLANCVAPSSTGFEMLLVVERPGTTALVRFPVGLDGELGVSISAPLGYTPAIRPVARVDDKGILYWGIARRGPTLVVHRLTADGMTLASSQKAATARGFLGRHLPVLVNKGGVVMEVTAKGTGAPLRAPSDFPPRISAAAPHGDQVFAAWLAPRVDDDTPGGLRFAWLVKRGAPEVEALTWNDAVLALDVLATPAGVWMAWVERTNAGFEVRTTLMPEGGIATLPLDEGVVPQGVRFVPGPLGQPDPSPLLVVLTDEHTLVATDVDGRPIAQVR